MTAAVIGRMDFSTATHIIKTVSDTIHQKNTGKCILDITGVSYFDDYGALTVEELRAFARSRKIAFELVDPDGLSQKIATLVDFSPKDAPDISNHQMPVKSIIFIGETAIEMFKSVVDMISFLGATVLSFFRVMVHPKAFRFSDTLMTMEKAGVRAVPIVALISFLLGLVIAFMSSLQLKQFGANIYVASLVSIGMVSELGPIMTAIVVAGRSGSAFAAEIGTMKISEEIDALTTMGFDPVVFLGVPRITAAMFVVPILTMFSNIFAILGGLVVGVTLLNLTMRSYIVESLDVLDFFEVFWGGMKSVVFAVIISMVGCLKGFEARGGADAVGNAATSAVVTSIFLIILFDSFFAILRSYWW